MKARKLLSNKIFQISLVGILSFGLGLGFSFIFLSKPVETRDAISTLPLNLTQNEKEGFATLSDIQAAFQSIAQKVSNAVVQINVATLGSEKSSFFDFPFRFFFEREERDFPPNKRYRQEGLGSGVIVRQIEKTVYVLTNNHVIEKANEIEIVMSNKDKYLAKVIGKDPKKDLALLSFQAESQVPVAILGDSDSVAVGDWVIAVGSPLGFTSSVTQGIISAVGRTANLDSSIAPYTSYLQTDAAINQGNSGGALINIKGEVIGINTWIASPTGGSVGIGFAIPINTGKKVIEDFLTTGDVKYGWLGVAVSDLKEADLTALGLNAKKGSFVLGIYKNSPAAQAGIMPGDFIVAVNNKPIEDLTSLLVTIGNLTAGTKATINLIRGGKKIVLEAEIKNRPSDQEITAQAIWPGLTVVTITKEIRRQLRLSSLSGNLVVGRVEKGSAAEAADIRAGDVVLEINAKRVNTLADFYHHLNEKGQNQVIFTLQRNNNKVTVGIVK